MTSSSHCTVDVARGENPIHPEKSHEWNCYMPDQTNSEEVWLEHKDAKLSSEAMKVASQISHKSAGDHSNHTLTSATQSTASFGRLTSGCSNTPIALRSNTPTALLKPSNERNDSPDCPARTSAESANKPNEPAVSIVSMIKRASREFTNLLNNKSSTGEGASISTHRDYFYFIAVVVVCIAMAFLVLRRTIFML